MKQMQTDAVIYWEKTAEQKDLVIRKLHDCGYRMTRQRQILLDVILSRECASCKEIYYKANSIEPSIGMATVYRLISLLEDMDVLRRRNILNISCQTDCDKRTCTIRFEDNTCCRLTKQKLYTVIEKGLNECGYGCGKQIRNVVLGADSDDDAC